MLARVLCPVRAKGELTGILTRGAIGEPAVRPHPVVIAPRRDSQPIPRSRLREGVHASDDSRPHAPYHFQRASRHRGPEALQHRLVLLPSQENISEGREDVDGRGAYRERRIQ